MNKLKEYAMITVIALAFLLITGIAKADTQPKQFVETVASVPGKVSTHIKDEWAETKEYQANSWAEIKFKFKGLKEKFQAKQ
jgi:hypothetical protein|tara:strand:- start:139 stop:384 length:246 start_codon:yes stop_codon:yes gene_type:complete